MTGEPERGTGVGLALATGLVAGVYGLQITGIAAPRGMAQVDAEAPILHVTRDIGVASGREAYLDDSRAEIELIDEGWLSLARTGHARYVLPNDIDDGEMLHPWLAPAAATFNGWHGRQVFHGGVFSYHGKAIALLGDKEDGKSTLLAWLSQRDGVTVLADDLIVVDSGQVLAGPRCIDLRPGAAQAISSSSRGDVVRDNSRFRLNLGPCEPSAPLHAIVVIGWADQSSVTLRQLGAVEAIGALVPHAHNVHAGIRLLDLLDVPTWTLARPKSWSAMDDVTARLCALVD